MGFQLHCKFMAQHNWGNSEEYCEYTQSDTDTDMNARAMNEGDETSLGYASSGNCASDDGNNDWMGLGGARWEVVSDTYEELQLGDHFQVDREVYESVTYWDEPEGEIECEFSDEDESNEAMQWEMNVTGVTTSDDSYVSPLFEAMARDVWHSDCAESDDASK